MLAESHGKLSPESTQAHERLEDLLTDYVFGSLKRLSRDVGLREFLKLVVPELNPSESDLESAVFDFWPMWGDTEPDIALLVGQNLIVIEAKLWSGFSVASSDRHQLVREYRRAQIQCKQRNLKGPWIVAVTASYDEPTDIASANATIGLETSPIRWTNWQSIASALEATVDEFSVRDQELVADLLTIMERRGVKTMFEGFVQEDYWLMAAAQRRASEHVYPAIASFCKDLLAVLGESNIRRGTADWRIVSFGSWSLDSPNRWGGNYVFLPLWPERWPERRKWDQSILVVQFSLREPEMWVGYRQAIEPRQVKAWQGNVDSMIAWARSAGPDYRLHGSKYPDLHTPLLDVAAVDVDDAWLGRLLDLAGVHLMLYRSVPLDDLTSTEAIAEMVLEDIALVESNPFLLDEALEKKMPN